jgi:hypothetical protein
VRALVDEIVLVADNDIRAAMALIADTNRRPRRAFRRRRRRRRPVTPLPGERIAVILTGAWPRPDWARTVT